MQYVEALEYVLELRVELVEAGAVHVVAVAPHEGHALRREAVGALVELPHHVAALGKGLGGFRQVESQIRTFSDSLQSISDNKTPFNMDKHVTLTVCHISPWLSILHRSIDSIGA